MWQRVRLGTMAAAAIAALLSPIGESRADIDTSGRWVVRGPWATYLAYEVETWTQTGTSITTSDGYAGTISPATGEINMTRPGISLCPADTRTGTVAADGLSLTGFEKLHPTYDGAADAGEQGAARGTGQPDGPQGGAGPVLPAIPLAGVEPVVAVPARGRRAGVRIARRARVRPGASFPTRPNRCASRPAGAWRA